MSRLGSRLALGLDIGGSSVKAGLIALDDNRVPVIIDTRLATIDQARQPGHVIRVLAELSGALRDEHGPVCSIGVGLPGLFDAQSGAPTLLPNFPKIWHGYPFRDAAEAALKQRVTLVNDAKALSVAEAVLGAGRGLHAVACFVLGTGVGGGVVIGGRLWRGVGYAGEFGHLTIDINGPVCGCGSRGCVEAYAGAPAICRVAGRDTVDAVFAAASADDPAALMAVRSAVEALAAGMANVFVAIAPDAVIVGGGIAGAGAQLFRPLEASIRGRVRVAAPEQIRLLRGELGRYGGSLGAALVGASDTPTA
jgi:glucokinase